MIKEIDTFKRPIKLLYKTGLFKKDTYHYHEGIELLFIHQGQGRIIVNNQIHDIQPGCMLIFQPFQLHQVQLVQTEGSLYERTLCIFDPQLIAASLEHFVELSKFFHYLWKNQLSQHLVHTPHMELFGQYARGIHARFKELDERLLLEQSILFIQHALQTIYLNWSYSNAAHAYTIPRSTHHVELIMQWIEANFRADFDLNRLSRDLHLSKYHMSRLFREVTGNSITEYIMARRIREACLLLRTTQHSVQEICEQIGLTSSSYFSSLFKKQMGISPKQYRLK